MLRVWALSLLGAHNYIIIALGDESMRERLLKEVLTSILPKNDVTRRRKWVCVCECGCWRCFSGNAKVSSKLSAEWFTGSQPQEQAGEQQQLVHAAAMKKESARRGALKWLKTPTPALSLARPKCAVYYIALCLFTRCSLFLILRRRARSPWRSRAEFIYCARVKTAAPYSHTEHGGAASPSFELQEAFEMRAIFNADAAWWNEREWKRRSFQQWRHTGGTASL